MGEIGKGLEYLKSVPAILKIVEFVVYLINIGCVGYFLDKTNDSVFDFAGKKGNLEFFLAVSIIGWILVMTLFTLFVTGLYEKISAINWSLTVAVQSALWVMLFLIASSLVADAARHYDSKKICEGLDNVKADSRCGHLIAGAIFGFVAMVLLAVDTAIHVRMFLTRGAAPKASAAAVSS